MPLEVGLSATITREVGPEDLGPRFETSDVDLLATPRIIAWAEAASMAAVAPKLGPEETSVGMRVRIDHIYPARAGQTVHITATLARIEGQRLTFQIEAEVAGNPLAVGQVVRVVLDRQRYLDRIASYT